jgi:hypothetical protein
MTGSELTLAQAKRLIGGFAAREKPQESPDAVSPERLLAGFRKALVRTREAQRKNADELDLLHVLGIDKELKEAHHSRFLAWLMDPRETHAQGSLFLRIFLEKVGLPEEYADTEYEVRREQQGNESRPDIVVASRERAKRGFVIYIENKVTAGLGPRQIERQAADLRSEARARRIPRGRMHGILLTPEPESPRSKLFRRIGWDTIERCLEEFTNHAQAEAPRARYAADQYTRCIRRHKPGAPTVTEEENDEKADRS